MQIIKTKVSKTLKNPSWTQILVDVKKTAVERAQQKQQLLIIWR